MSAEIDAAWAFRRYRQIQDRLPSARFSDRSVSYTGSLELIDTFDVFALDSFGVLNVGETAVPGAATVIDELRHAGKKVFVLTNAASAPLAGLRGKYEAMGFDFAAEEIISSRGLLASTLDEFDDGMIWAVAASPGAGIDELPCHAVPLDETSVRDADGIILIGMREWTPADQHMLEQALIRNPRPVLVGNADLAAPRENGFTLQPGAYAHALIDATGIAPLFFGKPYRNAFDELLKRAGPEIEPGRIIMIGDTLHTDVLGGAAAGIATALATNHGILRGLDVDACIAESGIRPDFIMPTI